MLNLDFAKTADGVIPSKTLFPLHVPLNGLEIKTTQGRSTLVFQQGQGLDIPHSSLLDPDGQEWIVMIRVFALSDGIILSQDNGETGYTIHIKDGAVYASIKDGPSCFTLTGKARGGTAQCLNKWTSIELRFRPDKVLLNIDRNRVAQAWLAEPFAGKDLRIRLGQHRTLPASLRTTPGAKADGFAGFVASLKLLRQSD